MQKARCHRALNSKRNLPTRGYAFKQMTLRLTALFELALTLSGIAFL
jgi:hypothetical protein